MSTPPMQPARVQTALGTLELLLPEGAALEPDPGVADGELLAWAPQPELGAFSISHGPAEGRRPEDLLTLERGFADEVDVEEGAEGELCLRVDAECNGGEPHQGLECLVHVDLFQPHGR